MKCTNLFGFYFFAYTQGLGSSENNIGVNLLWIGVNRSFTLVYFK